MERFKRKMNFKYKIFMLFVLITMIPVLLLGAYSYITYTQAISNEMDSYIEGTINQLAVRTDQVIKATMKYYVEASQTEEMKWISNEHINYSNYIRLTEVQQVLKGPDYLSEYIKGYTYLNKNTNWVLSNKGMFPYSNIENLQDIETALAKSVGWINNSKLDISEDILLKREQIDVEGVSFFQSIKTGVKNEDSKIVVNINFQPILQEVLSDNGNFEIAVLDQEGKLLFCSQTSFGNSLENEYQSLNPHNRDLVVVSDGTNYRIGNKISEITGWNYYVGWNLDKVFEGAVNIVWMSIVIGFCGVGLLLLILIMTNVVYRPVRDLKDYANGIFMNSGLRADEKADNENSKSEDAFKQISGKIEYLMDNTLELREKCAIQQAQLSEFFLSRLINGSLRLDQIEGYLQRLNIKMEQFYLVITISLQNSIKDIYDEVKQDDLRLRVAESIPMHIRNELVMEPSCNAKVITLVITSNHCNELEKKVIEVYKDLDIYVQMEYHFPIKMGISNYHEDLRSFRSAHYQAIEALKNNDILYQNNSSTHFEGVMFYSDIAGFDHDKRSRTETCSFRIEERDIKEAVDKGIKDKADFLVNGYLDKITSKFITETERQFHIYHLVNELMSVPMEAGFNIDEIFTTESANIYQMMTRIYDSDKMKSFLKSMIVHPIINYLNEARTSKASEIITDIKRLIEKKQGDLTLSECAEQLGYHTTYIWKVMRVELNITFSEYIANLKVNQAKDLLVQSELSVNEISEHLKYTNAQNFIRFFSKIEGITPGKYRKAHKCR